ncbi:MAG: hypothetical protein K0R31_508 [Clostridiales bacterium]|nr:hypothetical protein [Clostridiales bacterium]
MKKIALRIYNWILFSIILQVTIYLFINNIYLSNRSNISNSIKFVPAAASVIEGYEKVEAEKGVRLPLNIKNISISYDQSLAAYIYDDKLEIFDLNEKKVKTTFPNQFNTDNEKEKNKIEGEITAFTWLSDKNTLIYAMSTKKGAPTRAQLTTYDADSGISYTGVTMTGSYLPNGSTITDLAVSPLNMIIYAKTRINETQARFYRINIMNEIYASFITGINALVKIGRYGEVLFYQDKDYKIYCKNGMYNAPIQLQFPNKMALLDVIPKESEGKDYAYAGYLNEDGKVQKIFYGKTDAPVTEWASMDLKESVKPENILISKKGVIYLIKENENAVYNLQTNAKTIFTGKFIGVVDKAIAHLDNDLLKFTPLKQ